MSPIDLTAQLLNGVLISVFYALTALGLSLIFGVLRIVNFAHGELYMMGGFAYYVVASLVGVPPAAAVLLASAGVFLLGALLAQGGMREADPADVAHEEAPARGEEGVVEAHGERIGPVWLATPEWEEREAEEEEQASEALPRPPVPHARRPWVPKRPCGRSSRTRTRSASP